MGLVGIRGPFNPTKQGTNRHVTPQLYHLQGRFGKLPYHSAPDKDEDCALFDKIVTLHTCYYFRIIVNIFYKLNQYVFFAELA